MVVISQWLRKKSLKKSNIFSAHFRSCTWTFSVCWFWTRLAQHRYTLKWKQSQWFFNANGTPNVAMLFNLLKQFFHTITELTQSTIESILHSVELPIIKLCWNDIATAFNIRVHLSHIRKCVWIRPDFDFVLNSDTHMKNCNTMWRFVIVCVYSLLESLCVAASSSTPTTSKYQSNVYCSSSSYGRTMRTFIDDRSH